jgi:hypothetical protein
VHGSRQIFFLHFLHCNLQWQRNAYSFLCPEANQILQDTSSYRVMRAGKQDDSMKGSGMISYVPCHLVKSGMDI